MAPRSLDPILSDADRQRLVAAIQAAESQTSGEIKVHVEARCPGGDAMARARELFAKLGLTRTRERNGVLIYVAVSDRRFALFGDQGIHEEVGSPFWSEAASAMSQAFSRGAFADGIAGAIESVGKRLTARFPRPPGERVNQLSDEISTGEEEKQKP
jgi:uncharacterized membrane protein